MKAQVNFDSLGGGDTINPVVDSNNFTTIKNSTKNFTIDANKKYLLSVISTYNGSEILGGIVYIENGSYSAICQSQPNAFTTNIVITISGNSLSVTTSWAGALFSLTLVQLD